LQTHHHERPSGRSYLVTFSKAKQFVIDGEARLIVAREGNRVRLFTRKRSVIS